MSREQRQQSGPPVTSVPALSSHQLVRLPTRSTVSLPCLAFAPKSSTFVQQGILRPRTVQGPPHTGGIHLTRRSAKILCVGTVGSPDSLPLKTPVDSGSYQQVQPGGVTLDGALEMVRQRHQRNELKRTILVSSQWGYATEPATRVNYESNHS